MHKKLVIITTFLGTGLCFGAESNEALVDPIAVAQRSSQALVAYDYFKKPSIIFECFDGDVPMPQSLEPLFGITRELLGLPNEQDASFDQNPRLFDTSKEPLRIPVDYLLGGKNCHKQTLQGLFDFVLRNKGTGPDYYHTHDTEYLSKTRCLTPPYTALSPNTLQNIILFSKNARLETFLLEKVLSTLEYNIMALDNAQRFLDGNKNMRMLTDTLYDLDDLYNTIQLSHIFFVGQHLRVEPREPQGSSSFFTETFFPSNYTPELLATFPILAHTTGATVIVNHLSTMVPQKCCVFNIDSRLKRYFINGSSHLLCCTFENFNPSTRSQKTDLAFCTFYGTLEIPFLAENIPTEQAPISFDASSDDQLIVVGYTDSTIRLFKVHTDRFITHLKTLQGPSELKTVFLSQCEQYLVAVGKTKVLVIDRYTHKTIYSIETDNQLARDIFEGPQRNHCAFVDPTRNIVLTALLNHNYSGGTSLCLALKQGSSNRFTSLESSYASGYRATALNCNTNNTLIAAAYAPSTRNLIMGMHIVVYNSRTKEALWSYFTDHPTAIQTLHLNSDAEELTYQTEKERHTLSLPRALTPTEKYLLGALKTLQPTRVHRSLEAVYQNIPALYKKDLPVPTFYEESYTE